MSVVWKETKKDKFFKKLSALLYLIKASKTLLLEHVYISATVTLAYNISITNQHDKVKIHSNTEC